MLGDAGSDLHLQCRQVVTQFRSLWAAVMLTSFQSLCGSILINLVCRVLWGSHQCHLVPLGVEGASGLWG